MERSYRMILVMVAVFAALVIGACAPAAESKPQVEPSATQAAPAESKQTAESPKTTAPQASKPQSSKEAPISPGVVAPKESAATKQQIQTSVSGIPLDPTARYGGVLRRARSSSGPTFSIWEESAGISYYAGQPVTNMLVQIQTWGTRDDYNEGAYLNIHPDLAASWEQSADGLRWIFRLREGVKWSDGTPFTCADTKWSFDTIRTGEGLRRSPRAPHFLSVDSIQCPDDRTLVFNMKRPKPGFLAVLAMAYHVVLPEHRYNGRTDDMREKPWDTGTGPFRVDKHVAGERITFTRQGDYWDQPFPYLDGIDMVIGISSTAEDAALRTGRIDIPSSWCCYNGQRAENILRECKDCQTWPPLLNNDIGVAVVVNHQQAPWNTPEIKDAISLAIDRVKFGQLVAPGGWIKPAIAGPYQPGTYWAMPYEIVKQYPGYNIDTPAENKQRARELLAQAGYKPGELALPLEVWNTPSVLAWQPPLIEDLQAVGFKVEPYVLETANHYDVLVSGDYAVGLHNYWVSHIDPDVVLYENYYTGSDRNYQHYANPEVDRMVDDMSVTLDVEARRQKAWDIGEVLLREQALLNLGHYVYQVFIGPQVQGLMPAWGIYNGYGPINRLDHVWLTGSQ